MAIIPADIVLENDRVRLRLLRESDYENLLPFAMAEPGLWKFSLKSGAGEEGMKQYISQALADYESGSSFPFVVYDKKANAYAGSTRFYDIQANQLSLQLGYTWYGSSFQGTGLNKNCKLLLLEYAFESLGMERVEFRADANNKRSVAAMQSIGCTPEGILRSHVFTSDSKRRDSIILSILKSEWTKNGKNDLLEKIKNLPR